MSRSNITGNTGESGSPFEEKFEKSTFFPAVSRLNLLARIRQDIAEQVSVIVVTGDDGSGKSVIYTMLKEEGISERLSVFCDDSVQSFGEVIRLVAEKVDLEVTDLSRAGKAKALDEIAVRVEERNLQLVLVCDGAEKIFLATLERIRKMLDKLNNRAVHMQIALIGRKMLLDNLEQLKICNIAEVPETRYVLEPFSLSETTRYVQQKAHRLEPAQAELFTSEVIDRIYRAADGNVSKVNTLAGSLLKGEDIRPKAVGVVGKSLKIPGIKGQVKGVQSSSNEKNRRVPMKAYPVLTGILIFGILVFLLSGGEDKKSEDTEKTGAVEVQSTIKLPDGEAVNNDRQRQIVAEDSGEAELSPEKSELDQTVSVESSEAQSGRKVSLQTFASDSAAEKDVTVVSGTEAVSSIGQATSGKEGSKKAERDPSEQSNEVEKAEQLVADSAQVKETEEIAEHIVSTNVLDRRETKESMTIEPSGIRQEVISSDEDKDSAVNQESSQDIVSDIIVLRPEKIKKLIKREGKLKQESEEASSSIVISSLTSSDDPDMPLQKDNEEEKRIVPEARSERAEEPPVQEMAETIGAEKEIDATAAIKSDTVIAASNTKRIQQVGEAIVPVVDRSATDSLYLKRLTAGETWLKKAVDDKYTLQLMVLSSDNAYDNMRRILTESEYVDYVDNFYILEKDSTPPSIFVFYGEYSSMTAARDARDSVPEVLKKHNPYALSIPGAVRKVR